MLGSKISGALESNSFTTYFMHLGLWREVHKEDCMEVGESKVRIGLQDS